MIHQQKIRRGAAMLVVVLTCLLVVSALVRAMSLSTVRERRILKKELQLRQTELLLDAGVLRAARQLEIDPEYQGESWQPDSALQRFAKPRVEILVTTVAGDRLARSIRVVAQLSAAGEPQAGSDFTITRRSHTFQFNPSTTSKAE